MAAAQAACRNRRRGARSDAHLGGRGPAAEWHGRRWWRAFGEL